MQRGTQRRDAVPRRELHWRAVYPRRADKGLSALEFQPELRLLRERPGRCRRGDHRLLPLQVGVKPCAVQILQIGDGTLLIRPYQNVHMGRDSKAAAGVRPQDAHIHLTHGGRQHIVRLLRQLCRVQDLGKRQRAAVLPQSLRSVSINGVQRHLALYHQLVA